ncbi:MFS general substrate transporter [Linderina pennispora]|uniref:MFS general substrate transporter n=1 Tax=Linderina pennispora TaxID=61395 RepID=A0A1Y1W1A1_9FUNG|nr:MFS general substrate transporter [Linderina pennispora]ORX67313.1 MFS general substrate transporter [Linderina pennispora]
MDSDKQDSDTTASSSSSAIDKQAALRRYLRKVDLRLLLWLWLLNIFCQFDKQAIGSAKVLGLEHDLHLTGSDFNIAATLFSVGFLLFDPISPYIVSRVGASKALPVVVLLFGTVCGLTALAHSKRDIYLLRFFLGIAESGFAPGVLFLFSTYYPRDKITARVGWYYSASPAGGLIGGVMSSGISHINHPTIEPWRWIYIVLGCITLVLGSLSFFSFIAEENAHAPPEKVKAKEVLNVLKDWQVWAFGATCMLTSCGCSSINVFAPSIIKNYGFTASQSQALLAVPSIFGFFAMVSAGYLVRRLGSHFLATVLTMSLVVIGTIILLATLSVPARMVGLCLMAGGTRHGRKANVSSAFVPMLGGLSVFVASNAYTNNQQPRYLIGHGINLTAAVLAILFACLLRFNMARRNKRNLARYGEGGEYFKYIY